MNLIEALEILKKPVSEEAPSFRAFLACGFSPLHLHTFLRANLCERFPGHSVAIETGLFGDLAGNLERVSPADFDVVAVVIEWQDLDPRLGIRNLGGWRTEDLPDIVNSVSMALDRVRTSLQRISSARPVGVSLPTLPLPPLFFIPNSQASRIELQLRQAIASFALALATEPTIRVVSIQRIDELSPMQARLDLSAELMAGFPYKLTHAAALAELFAELFQTPRPKKGLITDLDDTLWAGIVGEVGVEAISWDLDQKSHMHGLYQQFLSSLASAGVLIGVASKNDPETVKRAFERKDLRVKEESIYPVEAHWSPKSESVRKILKLWNIGSESVVFIDDSPMEVAEVQAAFPDLECILFPKKDPEAILRLLRKLRNSFGKRISTEEDGLRLKSIRQANAVLPGEQGGTYFESFLRDADASIRISFAREAKDQRAFELINKTNQFNLNGLRISEAEWRKHFQSPDAFLMTLTYEDKYGPLGKIAALLGQVDGGAIRVKSWVMSCRAFSRRIEHQMINQIFAKFGVEQIYFEYEETARNQPLREFFAEVTGESPVGEICLSRRAFEIASVSLVHRVEEVVNG